MLQYRKTRFDDGEQRLLYALVDGTNVGRGLGKRDKKVRFWRFFHQVGDDTPRDVGPEYSSEKKLLADAERYGTEFGFK